LLEVENINTYYWETHVLWDVSLKVPQGSVVAMLGRNGMGKTTIIRSIMGLTPPRDGVIRFKNEAVNGLEPYQIARKGIALVPQGRCVFPSLSVKENLMIGARDTKSQGSWNLEGIYSLFPILKERARLYANLLSGGEQQMLAVARALMANPDLLIMDEPSEGLAPMVIRQIGQVICQLKGKLTVFLAEQNLNMALSVADYVYIISKGSVVYESGPEELKHNEEIKQKWLGV
jgi:branched-chain amino acid transport system ATP-binding protein